jgi:hypothetical protein
MTRLQLADGHMSIVAFSPKNFIIIFEILLSLFSGLIHGDNFSIALPQLSNIALAGGQIVLTFPTTLNQNYQVVSTTDLTTGTWTAWGDPIVGTGGTVSVTNSPTGDQNYFRLELQQ